jgi:hypothetical protein
VAEDYLTAIRESLQSVLALSADDVPVVDYAVCLSFANVWHEDQDSVWGYIVGPPGGGKTLIQSTLERWSKTIYIDELTENSLASGAKTEDGEDISLLPKLHGKTLCVRDFSTVMSMNPVSQAKILSALRCCFDGSYAKASGKEGLAAYEAKFGILACVTPEIDHFLAQQQRLGERFILLRIQRSGMYRYRDRLRRLRHVRMKMANKKKWVSDLKAVVESNLSQAHLHLKSRAPHTIEIPEKIGLALDAVADLVCQLRTAPIDGTPTSPEAGNRLVQELVNVVRTRAALSGRAYLNTDDLQLARRIAHDTLPSYALKIFSDLLSTSLGGPSRFVSQDQLSERGHKVPMQVVHNCLLQWRASGLVTLSSQGHRYRLTTDGLEEACIANLTGLSEAQISPPDDTTKTNDDDPERKTA